MRARLIMRTFALDTPSRYWLIDLDFNRYNF
ncbi:TPA: YsgD/CorL family protein [Serratia odorifera]